MSGRQKSQVHAWGESDVGRRRSHNEDSMLVEPELGLFAVADGMGGHESGDVASKMALELLERRAQEKIDFLRNPHQNTAEGNRQQIRDYLDQVVQELTYSLFSLSRSKRSDKGMGTTLCALLALGEVAAIIHVGDSRCYLVRDNQIYQLTEDHTLVLQQLKMGLITPEEAASSRYKNVITRAVGMADRVQADIFFVDLLDQDRFLLCSDGLHGYFQPDELLSYVYYTDPVHVPAQLIQLANARGGKDNITAVLALVEGQEQLQSSTQITDGMGLLRNNPLFQEMTYQEILKVMPLTTTMEFQVGEVLMREGEPGTYLYIVQKGSLAVYHSGEMIAALGAGDYVGEMGIFDGEPCSATVVAQHPSRCLGITGTDLLQIARQQPDMGFKIQQSFIRVLSSRLRSTSRDLSWTRREWRRSNPS